MTTMNVSIALALISAFACGGGGDGYSTSPTTNQPGGPSGNPAPGTVGISVTNNEFTPSTPTVPVGTTVRWTWNSCSEDVYLGRMCTDHSVTFDDGSTSSATQNQGTFSRTFTVAKTYNYHCAVHGAAMAGSITVQ
jgi:plastocyanin